jgi:hypothetical protein
MNAKPPSSWPFWRFMLGFALCDLAFAMLLHWLNT